MKMLTKNKNSKSTMENRKMDPSTLKVVTRQGVWVGTCVDVGMGLVSECVCRVCGRAMEYVQERARACVYVKET